MCIQTKYINLEHDIMISSNFNDHLHHNCLHRVCDIPRPLYGN